MNTFINRYLVLLQSLNLLPSSLFYLHQKKLLAKEAALMAFRGVAYKALNDNKILVELYDKKNNFYRITARGQNWGSADDFDAAVIIALETLITFGERS